MLLPRSPAKQRGDRETALRENLQNLIHVVIVVVDRYREAHVIPETAYGQGRIRPGYGDLGPPGAVCFPDLVFRRFDVMRNEGDDRRLGAGGRNAGVAPGREFLA